MSQLDDRSEEALRLALDEQRHLLEDIDVIVWKMVAATRRIIYATGALGRLGYAASTWSDDPEFFERILVPGERAATLALVRLVAADGVERQCVHRAIGASGAERWFRTRVRAQRARDGGVILLGVMLDVTERAATETTLRESEAHLRRVLEQLPALVWTADRDMRFTSGVGRELAALGIPSSAALMGVSVQEYLNITDPDDPRLVSYRRALAGEPVSVDSDWAGHSYQTQAEPFRDARGEIVGILAVSWNVTARKKAERGLKLLAAASVTLGESLDYEETLRKVARLAVGSFADWCIVTVADGDLLRPVAAAHVDPTKDALFPGLPPLNLSVADDWTAKLKDRKTVFLAEVPEDIIGIGTVVPMPPGQAGVEASKIIRRLGMRSLLIVPLVSRRQMLGTLTFVRITGDRPYERDDVALAEDLARRCAAAIDNATLYRAAQAAIDARDEFLSVASHELRTPLTSIQLRLEALEKAAREGRTPTLAGPQGALGIVLKQFKRLANLVEQLLDVSRIRRGTLDLELEQVDLAQLLRDVAARFEGDLARAGSSLSITAPAPALGQWDRGRIEQVVTDLLSNAIKFARGTTIEAEVASANGRARLVVRDHGMGISATDQARIFERFERAASPRHFGGLGLGLYITRQIVEAHGGTVRLTSTLGVGTTVTVEIPRVAAPSVSTPGPP